MYSRYTVYRNSEEVNIKHMVKYLLLFTVDWMFQTVSFVRSTVHSWHFYYSGTPYASRAGHARHL